MMKVILKMEMIDDSEKDHDKKDHDVDKNKLVGRRER